MIIGIAGNINSGKDTVASILNYIFAVGKHKAKYSEWLIKRLAFDQSYSNRITHFADTIKDNLSNIFSIPRHLFDDRKHKDELWYSPYTGKFIEEKDLSNEIIKYTLDNPIELLQDNYTVVKLRTLIQLYAEHIKLLFGERIWIKNTLINASEIDCIFNYCLIPDVRFHKEVDTIWKFNGIVIQVKRPNEEIKSNHCSENNILSCNYTIENNGTLQELFYKVLAIYERIKY